MILHTAHRELENLTLSRQAMRFKTHVSQTVGDVVSDVALEVQRSLDYFESHYDQRPIVDLVLGPGASAEFTAILADQLGLTVAVLDLNDLFDVAEPIPVEQQSAVIVALGAALRTKPAGAAT